MELSYNEDWIKEITRAFPNCTILQEGGYSYLFFPNLKTPEGCTPSEIDALLCVQPRDGYSSRLFLSQKLTGCPNRNWNANICILDRNWFAISWQSQPGLSYLEMLALHLKAFRNE